MIVTDGASPQGLVKAFLAIQILQKLIGMSSSSICVCTDNYNVQKTLQEKFPRITVIFASTTESFTQSCISQTNGLGFDIAIDFSQSHIAQTSKKREILSTLGMMGIWATVAQ